MWRFTRNSILNYATVCLHPSVSLNNEKNCRELSKDKIAVCEKTAGLRSGNSSDLNSACLKALVPVEIFPFSDISTTKVVFSTLFESTTQKIGNRFSLPKQK